VSVQSREGGDSGAIGPLVGGALEQLVEAIARRVAELQLELTADASPGAERSPWLSVASAADYLDWPKGRLYKLSARGQIPHYKHEGRLLFRRDELDAWLSRFAEGERA
jgi:excisionase family DNA binding protein